MGFRFHRRIKIAPGVRLNIGKKGIGVTLGPRGTSVSVGPAGTYVNKSIRGTGVSFRKKLSVPSFPDSEPQSADAEPERWSPAVEERPIKPLLWAGIFFAPFIFSWYTLRDGHSNRQRLMAFGWLVAWLLVFARSHS